MADNEKKTLGADMRVSGFGLFELLGAAATERKIALERLETEEVAGELGKLHYRADELVVDTLQTTLGRGQISAQSVDLASLELHDDRFELSAHRIGFPRGVLFTEGTELFAPHASVEDAHIVIHDLGQLFGRETERETRMEWRFLDVLDGRLDVDLVLDMTLPWIGQRRATHYFRVPIVDGTINYKNLEDDVHWLEAAFLTVEQDGDNLILARDLPLLPFSSKALLVFPLEPEDVPITAYHRVHLRNLVRPQRPARDRDKDRDKDKDKGKSRLTLHTLSLENIKIELHAKRPTRLAFPNGAMLQIGDDTQPGLVNLEMSGALRYEKGQVTQPTQLGGRIELIDLTINDLPLGSATLSADRFHISAIDRLEIGFQGLRPKRLELRASRIAATNLRVHLGRQ